MNFNVASLNSYDYHAKSNLISNYSVLYIHFYLYLLSLLLISILYSHLLSNHLIMPSGYLSIHQVLSLIFNLSYSLNNKFFSKLQNF